MDNLDFMLESVEVLREVTVAMIIERDHIKEIVNTLNRRVELMNYTLNFTSEWCAENIKSLKERQNNLSW